MARAGLNEVSDCLSINWLGREFPLTVLVRKTVFVWFDKTFSMEVTGDTSFLLEVV